MGKIDYDSFADDVGLCSGDELILVQGKAVNEPSYYPNSDVFLQKMQTRPLTLTFARHCLAYLRIKEGPEFARLVGKVRSAKRDHQIEIMKKGAGADVAIADNIWVNGNNDQDSRTDWIDRGLHQSDFTGRHAADVQARADEIGFVESQASQLGKRKKP